MTGVLKRIQIISRKNVAPEKGAPSVDPALADIVAPVVPEALPSPKNDKDLSKKLMIHCFGEEFNDESEDEDENLLKRVDVAEKTLVKEENEGVSAPDLRGLSYSKKVKELIMSSIAIPTALLPPRVQEYVDAETSIQSLSGINEGARARPATEKELAALWKAQRIDPTEFSYRLDKENKGPEPGEITMYTSYFAAGLTLPLDPFVARVFSYSGASLGELSPGSIKKIVSFAALCRLKGREPSPDLFLHLFSKATGDKLATEYYRPVNGRRQLLSHIYEKTDSWSTKIFYVSSRQGFGFPSKPSASKDNNPKAFEKLSHYNNETLALLLKDLPSTQGYDIRFLSKGVIQYFTGVGRRPYVGVTPILTPHRWVRDFSWPIHGDPANPVLAKDCPKPCRCRPHESEVLCRNIPGWSKADRHKKNKGEILNRWKILWESLIYYVP